jgi:DNA polymerase-3 subunit epsilon
MAIWVVQPLQVKYPPGTFLVPFASSPDTNSTSPDLRTPLQEVSFCVLDTETTGGHAQFDRVIDVGVFRLQGGEVIEKFNSLINPGRPIPEWITHLTGINNEMVERAPEFKDIAFQLQDFLTRGVFTAHNAGFDYGFIQNEFSRIAVRYESPQVCTVRLARQLLPELPSRSLGSLCEHLLIDISDRHRAHGDAEATAYVLKSFLRDLERHHGIRTWGELQGFLSLGVLDLPPGVSYDSILLLPSSPGQYEFKDESGAVICKGKVKNIQRRVQTYFKKTNTSAKSNLLRASVRSIRAEPNLGEPIKT